MTHTRRKSKLVLSGTSIGVVNDLVKGETCESIWTRSDRTINMVLTVIRNTHCLDHFVNAFVKCPELGTILSPLDKL